MLFFEVSKRRPELSVRLKGSITLGDLTDVAAAFELALDRMRPGFVLLVEYAELEGVAPAAQGVMFYLARCVFESNPELVLLVNDAGRGVSKHLRDFVSRLDESGKVHRFGSRALAETFLRERRLRRNVA